MLDAFISYASADAARAARVERALTAAKLRVWRDRSEIRLGALLRNQLQAGIRDSRTIVLLWSRAASRSRWVAAEILTGFHAGRFIVPCALDATPLPHFLAPSVHLNLERSTKKALEALCREVRQSHEGANPFPPPEASRSVAKRRAIDRINKLQHDELDKLQARAIPAAQRIHARADRAMRAAEKAWPLDPLVLTLGGYHRKNAYMLKHWEAVQVGRGPHNVLLARAERRFFETLFVDPTDPFGLDGLGSVLRLEREFDAAEFFFERASEQAARRGFDYPEPRQNLESVRRARQAQERGAAPAPRDQPRTRRAPANPSAARNDKARRTVGTRENSRTAPASPARDRPPGVESSDIGGLMIRAHALLEEGHAEESLRTFERALAIQPDLVEARGARGALLVGFNRIDEGLKEIDWVLTRRPRDAPAWYNKACAHSLLREGPTALEALARAIAAFGPYRATAAADPHLAFLREDPAFASRFRATVGA